jgi:hypothetical protein
MKKTITTIAVAFCLLWVTQLHAQIVVQIEAGSRSPFGKNQSLTIDKKGKCHYLKFDVETQVVSDSATFTLTKAQVDSFFKKADEVGFYGLKKEYHFGVDGAGIFIALSNSGKNNSVDLTNSDVPEINALIATLNGLLQPRKIKIYYGQK